jgi:hypothetical protein
MGTKIIIPETTLNTGLYFRKVVDSKYDAPFRHILACRDPLLGNNHETNNETTLAAK